MTGRMRPAALLSRHRFLLLLVLVAAALRLINLAETMAMAAALPL